MKKAGFFKPLAFTLFLVISFLAVGQMSRADVTGNIQGTVTNAAGVPLAGAVVSLITGNTEPQRVTTQGDGKFFFAGIPNGNYTLSTRLVTFETVTQPVAVQQDNTTTLNFTLKKSVVSTGISHAFVAPVRRTDPQTQYVITARTEQLTKSQPNNLYQFPGLVFGQPGITPDSGGYTHIRGSDSNQVGFEYDGIPITDPVQNTFATNIITVGMKSANLYTGGADASYGGSTGGFINLVSSSGRDLRGSIVEGTASVGHGWNYIGTNSQTGNLLSGGKLDYYVSTIQFRNDFPGNTQISSLNTSNDQLIKMNYYADPNNTVTAFISNGFETYNDYTTSGTRDPSSNSGYDLKFEPRLADAVHFKSFLIPHNTQPYDFAYITFRHNFDPRSFMTFRNYYLHDHTVTHAEGDSQLFLEQGATQRGNQLDYTNQISPVYQLRAGLYYIPKDTLYHRVTGITGSVSELSSSGYTDTTSDVKADETDAYLSNTFKPMGEKMTIALGARFGSEHFRPKAVYSSFTDQYIDPRLGIVYSPTPDLVFRTSYSIQSQFPDTRRMMFLSPQQLGLKASATDPTMQTTSVQGIYGSQLYKLKPEHAENIDFGIEKAITAPGLLGGLYAVSATIYRHRQYDQLSGNLNNYDIINGSGIYPLSFNNAGKSLATGLELKFSKAQRKPSDWNGFLSYTNQVAKTNTSIDSPGGIVGYQPVFSAYDLGNPLLTNADYLRLNNNLYDSVANQRHTVAIVADKRFSNFFESAIVLDAGSGFPFSGGSASDGILGGAADAQHAEKSLGGADFGEVPVTLTPNGSAIEPYNPVVGHTGWHYKISINSNFFLTRDTNLFLDVDNVFDKKTATNLSTQDLAGNLFYSPPTPQYPQGRNYFGTQSIITPIFITVGFRHKF